MAFRKANNIIYRSPPPPIGQEASETVEAADMLNISVDARARVERGTVVAQGEEKQTPGVLNDGF